MLFRALSNPNRLKVVSFLRSGPASVSDIVAGVGLKQAHVSRGLACLWQCGFVEVAREGRRRVYRLNGSTAPLLRAAEGHTRTYLRRLRACQQLG